MLRIIHTADLHLGQQLKGYDRTYELNCFIHFLSSSVVEYQADALIISGDIFHTYITSLEAENMFRELLDQVLKSRPSIRIIITSGNHDSAKRLDNLGGYCSLGNMGNPQISIVGSLSEIEFEMEKEKGQVIRKKIPDFSQLSFVLKNSEGDDEAVVLAFPYIRDLSYFDGLYDEQDQMASMHSLQENFRRMHQKGISYVRSVIGNKKIPIIVMDHASVGTSLANSGVLIGGEESYETNSIDGADYVALGHIHKAHKVGDCGYYSGSPYPVNFSEKDYRHEISLLSVKNGKIERQSIEIPRAVEMIELQIPNKDNLSDTKDEMINQLKNLIEKCKENEWTGDKRPFLKIVFDIPTDDSELKKSINNTVDNELKEIDVTKFFRFCGLDYRSLKKNFANEMGVKISNDSLDLEELDPIEVFCGYFRQKYPEKDGPSDDVLNVFKEILEECRKEEANSGEMKE